MEANGVVEEVENPGDDGNGDDEGDEDDEACQEVSEEGAKPGCVFLGGHFCGLISGVILTDGGGK